MCVICVISVFHDWKYILLITTGYTCASKKHIISTVVNISVLRVNPQTRNGIKMVKLTYSFSFKLYKYTYFTSLQLWFAVARHNFKLLKNRLYNLKPSWCIKSSFNITVNKHNFPTTKSFRMKIPMKIPISQYVAIFFNFSPTSSHLHPLPVENHDSNSRFVGDEDDNGKFRLESLKG